MIPRSLPCHCITATVSSVSRCLPFRSFATAPQKLQASLCLSALRYTACDAWMRHLLSQLSSLPYPSLGASSLRSVWLGNRNKSPFHNLWFSLPALSSPRIQKPWLICRRTRCLCCMVLRTRKRFGGSIRLNIPNSTFLSWTPSIVVRRSDACNASFLLLFPILVLWTLAQFSTAYLS